MPFRRWFVTTAAWIAAAVLLVAALLKISAAFTEEYHFDASLRDGFSPVSASYGIGIGEIALALCLISFGTHRRVWSVTAMVFFCLFCVSLSEGLAGRQNCDCFGTLIVRPYYTAALDLTLALSSIVSFYLVMQATNSVSLRRLLATCLLSVVLFFASLGLLFLREASSFAATIGMPTIVARLMLDATTSGSRPLQGNMLIAARGSKAVRIVGLERSCTLRLATQFPLVVEPGTTSRVAFTLRTPTDRPIGAVPANMFIDDDGGMRKVTLNLQLKEDML
jgi:hypothetical protein